MCCLVPIETVAIDERYVVIVSVQNYYNSQTYHNSFYDFIQQLQ